MSDPEILKPARLFVGLWPDTPVQKRLAEEGSRLHRLVGGKLTRQETIHLTLAFIGELARSRIDGLVDALSGVSATSFEMVFDRIRCWRHNRIGFAAPSQVPVELQDLVSGLEAVLEQQSVPFDRRPYKPHVTLVRKADCPKGIPALGRDSVSPEWGEVTPIRWSANEFVLVESARSSEGAAYRIVARFPLS